MTLRPFAAGMASCCAFFAAGCSLSPTAPPASSQGVALRGIAYGGQQPIVGSRVYLLAASTAGYSDGTTNPSVSLLNAAATGNAADAIGSYVVTDVNGSFALSGEYACTSGSQVYLYVAGGNAGGGTNTAIGLMAALGQCPAEGNFGTSGSAHYVPFIWVNEVTTVAAAYAMAGFAVDALHVGAPSADTVNHPYAQQGIANAFLNAANLVNIANGAAYTATPASANTLTPRTGTVPQTKINTIANLLATCVNSVGPGSTSCTSLFANTLSGGLTGTMPTDTATAAMSLAHSPGASAAILTNLWNLQPAVGAAFLLPSQRISPSASSSKAAGWMRRSPRRSIAKGMCGS